MSIKIIGTNQGQRGDLIMGTVVAKAIKERFPDSHFTLGINQKYQDMEDLFKKSNIPFTIQPSPNLEGIRYIISSRNIKII